MSIDFNEITNQRIPFMQIEFSSTRAQQGPSIQPYRILLLGQMLSAGLATANEVVKVDSLSRAKSLFGDNSDLAFMVKAVLANNKITDLYCLPVEDDGAGVQATGKITVATGTAGAAGTMYVYIAGRRITVAVASGDDQDDIATAIVAAISAYTDDMLPITAAVNGVNANEVDITARHAGETGNKIDIRLNYQSGDKFPEDITASVTAMASGATNPTLTTALANIGEQQYNIWAFPWVDATSLAAIEAELLTRWGATVAKEASAITCQYESTTNLAVLGNSRNSQFVTVFGEVSLPNMPLEVAAAAAGQIAYAGSNDPARPFQTLELKGILPPATADRLTDAQRNSLLGNGIATLQISESNTMLIERAITTYKTDSLGNPDTSFYDLNTVLTLSYIRYDLRAFIGRTFPRFKLADDNVRVTPGQAVVTPSIMKAAIIGRAKLWNQDLAIIEDFELFKSDLIVERNASDPNRLDVLMTPDLVNQLRQTAVMAQFLV